jgi:hypothetical protein
LDSHADEPPNQPEVKSGVTLPLAVSRLRWKLGRKAKQEPRFRFYSLYDRVYRHDVLTAAWWLVWKNNGAAGVDGQSCQDIIDGPGAAAFLRELHEELRTRRYRSQPVKRVYIPKPDGRQDVSRYLAGWGRYFAYGYPRRAFNRADSFTLRRLVQHLQRRSQRPFRPADGKSFLVHLQSLGLRLLEPSLGQRRTHPSAGQCS